jgi:hypothetical protein
MLESESCAVLPRARTPILMISLASIRKLKASLLSLNVLGGLVREPSLFQSLLPASKSQLSLPVNCAIKNGSVGGGSSNYSTVRGYSMETDKKFVSALGVLSDTSRVLLQWLYSKCVYK